MRILPRNTILAASATAARFGPATVLVAAYPARIRLLPHGHAGAYVTLITSGGYEERTGRETRRCTPGAIVIHGDGEIHENRFFEIPTRCVNLFTDARWRSEISRQDALGTPNFVFPSPVTHALIHRIDEELRHPDDLTALALQGLLFELIALLHRLPSALRSPAWLAAVRDLIARRFMEPLCLQDLAAAVGVHPAHLARAFRKRYRTSVGDALRRQRVEYVRQRLRSASPIAQIAQEAGFADQSHLTRTFRRLLGETPAAYRRRLRGW